MKQTTKAVFFTLVSLIGLLLFTIAGEQEVFIESRESKTVNGDPVFNKIKWFSFKDKDVWMMNQSHHGSTANKDSWDRLAIVVDKTLSPKTARFYQLEPGPLEWKDDLEERSFKVSCFICHNNGPRAIRPNPESSLTSLGVKDRLRISYWNLRIKLYGRVVAHATHDERDHFQKPPFRFRGSYANEPLQIAACTTCHKESGFMARGLLRRQQAPTIRFMLESGQMPPLGFPLTAQERQELETFLEGF